MSTGMAREHINNGGNAMNNTDARKFIFDLTQQVEQAPEGSISAVLAPTLIQTIWDVESIESQMRSELATIADRAERSRKALDEGMNINSLGEFHTSPANFDRLCGLRQQHWTTLKRLVHTLNEQDSANIDLNTLATAIAAKGA